MPTVDSVYRVNSLLNKSIDRVDNTILTRTLKDAEKAMSFQIKSLGRMW